MFRHLFLAATLFLATTALAAPKNDTLRVGHFHLATSQSLHKPFTTDSLNLMGKAFDASEVLRNNVALATHPLPQGASVLEAGTALKSNTLYSLRFTIDVDRWTNVKISAPKLRQFQTYINGKAEPSNAFQALPGRFEVNLLVYAAPQSTDTLDVQLIGENIANLRINDTRPAKYSLRDMILGKRFYNMSISPNGKYLLTHYVEVTPDFKERYSSLLTDLATQRTLASSAAYENWKWLPKRDVLYTFRSNDAGHDLVLIDPSTMRETVLARGLSTNSATFSPDEKFLVYSVKDEAPKANALKQLKAPDDRMPGWRDRYSLFLYDLTRGTTQRLTYGLENFSLEDISPDGTRILFAQSKMNTTQVPFQRTNIYQLHVATMQVDTLIRQQPWLESASYSPDGRQLLVKASPAAFDGIGAEVKEGQHPQGFDQRLFLYDIATATARPLLRNFRPSVERTQWNAADNTIYMLCTDSYDRTLWRLNPRTLDRQRYELPVSLIQGFSIAKTRQPKLAFYGQTGTTARNGYLATLSSDKPRCTPFGEVSFSQLYGNRRVASCQPWKFTTSRGDEVEGFYYLPADFDATKQYPMIVYYYGGCVPTTRQLEFHYPLSVLANMGYAVLVLEPSGATGFGQEFAARHVNTWGQMSANDIIEGTKAFCAAHPYVNAKKVGCMGASYGGFMTTYLQTQTDIFAAAISHAGITNIASYWGGGYWGYTYGEVANYQSYPWNNPDLFVRQSALFQADKIHTPLLLLHGTVDTNVPTNESQQLFTALKILGREVSYIQVDGENHVIMEPHKRLQWQAAIIAWFAKHLQDDPTAWKTLGYE